MYLTVCVIRIVVYSPQLIENYQLKSGEGISTLFIFIWLAGDLCNLVGGILAGLLPTIIILAAYVRLYYMTSPRDSLMSGFLVHSLRRDHTHTNLLLPLVELETSSTARHHA